MNNHALTDHRIVLIAGEASGDYLGAALAKQLKQQCPKLKLTGMGGQQMRESGVDTFIDSQKLGIVGLFEIFKHLTYLLSARKKLKQYFQQQPIRLVIFIDYPGFNLHMAKYAQQAGLKVLYYVSPQIWAWRYHRIHKIKRYIDHMAVLFPFEEIIYKEAGVPVSFVGHPLVASAHPSLTKSAAYTYFHVTNDKPIIALFPGSREAEIHQLLPIIIKASTIIQQQIPNSQFILALAPTLSLQKINPYLPNYIHVISHQNKYDLLSIADVAITTSGTITLEAALLQTPMVIIYQLTLPWFVKWWLKKKIKIKHIGLCNLIAGKSIVPELIQDNLSAPAIAQASLRFLKDPNYRQSTVNALATIKKQLTVQRSIRLEQLILNLMQ